MYGVAQFKGKKDSTEATAILSDGGYNAVKIISIDVVNVRFNGKFNNHGKDIISIIEFAYSAAGEDKGGEKSD